MPVKMLHGRLLRCRSVLAASGRLTDKSRWRSTQPVQVITGAQVHHPVYARGTDQMLTRGTLQRWFADNKLPPPIVLPGTQSTLAPNTPPPPVITTTSPAVPTTTTIIPLENVPRTPPTPEEVEAPPPTAKVPPSLINLPPTITPPTSISPTPLTPSKTPRYSPPLQAMPPTSNPPTNILPPTGPGTASVAPIARPKKRRRGGRILLFLTSVLGLSYAGGVYYSLLNDNFHDFFTEYIPGGEEAVLFFEEREFKRRFPAGISNPNRTLQQQVRGEKKVTISGKSGLQARIQEKPKEGDAGTDTTQSSKMDARLGKKDPAVAETQLKLAASAPNVSQSNLIDSRLGKTDSAVVDVPQIGKQEFALIGDASKETNREFAVIADGPKETNRVASESNASRGTDILSIGPKVFFIVAPRQD